MATNEGEVTMGEKTIRELQTTLPWTIRYSRDFRANPQSHKDFAHAMVHAAKAVGKLMTLVDDMDHDRDVADAPALREQHAKYLADLVVCALRAANTFPGGVVDLQTATENRITTKNAPAPNEAKSGDAVIKGSAADFNCQTFTGRLDTEPRSGVRYLILGHDIESWPSFPHHWFKWLEVGSDVELTVESEQNGYPVTTWKGRLMRADRALGGVSIGNSGVIHAAIDWFNGIADGATVTVTTRPAR